jgi:hypothetical protein
MPTDDDVKESNRVLKEINEKIGQYEDEGTVPELEKILAPRLAFQRADPDRTVDDRVAFLQKVPGNQKGKSDTDRQTDISEPILYSHNGNIAVVRCVVSRNHNDYDNFRLFVRRDGEWKLLGWANELRPSSGGSGQGQDLPNRPL